MRWPKQPGRVAHADVLLDRWKDLSAPPHTASRPITGWDIKKTFFTDSITLYAPDGFMRSVHASASNNQLEEHVHDMAEEYNMRAGFAL